MESLRMIETLYRKYESSRYTMTSYQLISYGAGGLSLTKNHVFASWALFTASAPTGDRNMLTSRYELRREPARGRISRAQDKCVL